MDVGDGGSKGFWCFFCVFSGLFTFWFDLFVLFSWEGEQVIFVFLFFFFAGVVRTHVFVVCWTGCKMGGSMAIGQWLGSLVRTPLVSKTNKSTSTS